jgi:protein-tyrosine kinase
MSKIFEALKKTQGEIAELALPMVGPENLENGDGVPAPPADGGAVLEYTDRETDLEDAGVYGQDGDAAVPGIDEQAQPAAREVELRTLPVRIRADAPILPFQAGHSREGEQYRIARTKIIQHPDQPRSIVISSAGSGDGKTVSAINLAGALALKSDAQVMLVEADLRRPSVASLLGLPSHPGLSEYLAGSCALNDVITRIEQFPNLCVVPAGRSGANPTELLDSRRWSAACEEFRERSRFVIFDAPPMGTVADYDLIEAKCDGVIFVVRPDVTNRRLCLESLASVAEGKLIGVLMNCVSDWFLSRTRGYDYYRASSERQDGAA